MKLPWENTSKWKIDYYYPLYNIEFINGKEIIDGFSIFTLDPDGFEGDILPVFDYPCNFKAKDVFKICNEYNRKLNNGKKPKIYFKLDEV